MRGRGGCIVGSGAAGALLEGAPHAAAAADARLQGAGQGMLQEMLPAAARGAWGWQAGHAGEAGHAGGAQGGPAGSTASTHTCSAFIAAWVWRLENGCGRGNGWLAAGWRKWPCRGRPASNNAGGRRLPPAAGRLRVTAAAPPAGQPRAKALPARVHTKAASSSHTTQLPGAALFASAPGRLADLRGRRTSRPALAPV